MDGSYLEFSNWDVNPISSSEECAVMKEAEDWRMSTKSCNFTPSAAAVCESNPSNTTFPPIS